MYDEDIMKGLFISDEYIRYVGKIVERNKNIIAEYNANPARGSISELAKKYGISKQRVFQIIKRSNAERLG